jgi:hypothetical protein
MYSPLGVNKGVNNPLRIKVHPLGQIHVVKLALNTSEVGPFKHVVPELAKPDLSLFAQDVCM